MAHFMHKAFLWLGLAMAGLVGVPAIAGTVATAVIPVTVTGGGAPFTIVPDTAISSESGAVTQVTISFDMSAIPQDAQLTSAVLRLVPTSAAPNTQFLRIFQGQATGDSIGSINVPTTDAPVMSSGNGLVTALASRPSSLDLVLTTDSVRSKRTYYSFADSVASKRPRLIVSWVDNSPRITSAGNQLSYRGAPDDATPWVYDAPDGALLSVLFPPASTNMTVLTGPVFVGDTVVFMAKDADGVKLVGMNADGTTAWSYPPAGGTALPDTSWKYLRLDDQGTLYAFRNDGNITIFQDFGPNGPGNPETRALPEINLSKRPVISAGGMVVFRKDQSSESEIGNYIYALSPLPGLRTLWKSPANVGKSTAPVLSPRRGQQLVYVMGQDQSAGLSIFDNTTGTRPVPTGYPAGSDLGNFSEFHPPLTVLADPGAQTPSDWVYLSGIGASTGTLDGFLNLDKPGNPQRWNTPQAGYVSRCISPPPQDGAAPVIYCVQADQFRAYDHKNGELVCSSGGSSPMRATSNLVADGSGNIIFWQEDVDVSGVLRGFSPKCEMLFSEPLTGLPAKTDGIEVLDLRAGSNGIIYAYSTSQVFAIRVTRPAGNPTSLEANTQYFSKVDMSVATLSAPTDGPVSLYADGRLALDDLQVPAKANVTCSTRQALSFGVGFSVEVGATLSCGINKTTAKPAP